jgi:hypothetical protein
LGACGSISVDDSTYPRFIALDAQNIYYGNCDIRRVPIAGGPTTVMASFGGGAQGIEGAAIDSKNLYYCMYFGTVMASPLASGSSVTPSDCSTEGIFDPGIELARTTNAVDSYDPCIALTIDDSNVYFSDSLGVYKVSKSGGPTTTVVTMGSVYAASLATAGADLYVGMWDRGSIWKLPKAGGTPETVATAQYGLRSLAVDSLHLYWAGGGLLSRLLLSGGATSPVAKSDESSVALDEDSAYFCDRYELKKVPKGGGTVTTLTRDPCGGAIAVDDTYVYFQYCPTGNCNGLNKVVKR